MQSQLRRAAAFQEMYHALQKPKVFEASTWHCQCSLSDHFKAIKQPHPTPLRVQSRAQSSETQLPWPPGSHSQTTCTFFAQCPSAAKMTERGMGIKPAKSTRWLTGHCFKKLTIVPVRYSRPPAMWCLPPCFLPWSHSAHATQWPQGQHKV